MTGFMIQTVGSARPMENMKIFWEQQAKEMQQAHKHAKDKTMNPPHLGQKVDMLG